MGYSASFVAFHNKTPETIHTLLELDDTGRQQELVESDICGVALPSGWYAVIVQGEEFGDRRLASLSRGHKLCYGFEETHVMFSAASLWEDGQKRWSVTHNAQNGILDLNTTGIPSEPFAKIQEGQFALQRAEREPHRVDYIYDIPGLLTKQLIGISIAFVMKGSPSYSFRVLEKR